jgi:predicted HTH domain antitoxin
LEKFKKLFIQEEQREEKTIALLKQYQEAKISVGKIAENLNIDREEVLELMREHNIDLVDYNWANEEKNIEKYLTNLKDTSKCAKSGNAEPFENYKKFASVEFNLLKAYESGVLTTGQVSKILNRSKSDIIELLEKYKIPFITADKDYLEQEFGSFNKK